MKDSYYRPSFSLLFFLCFEYHHKYSHLCNNKASHKASVYGIVALLASNQVPAVTAEGGGLCPPFG